MALKIEGIIPVMLTPFTDQGDIDYPGLARLIEWYLAHGADALFAVAQSSEMQYLTLAERAALGRFVVKEVAGRVPVVVSGHISDDPFSQIEELSGKQVSDVERKFIMHGPEEHDLVHSGLEETMITATREIMEIWKSNSKIPDMRTAAYVNAINKVATSYSELGIFP